MDDSANAILRESLKLGALEADYNNKLYYDRKNADYLQTPAIVQSGWTENAPARGVSNQRDN